MVVVVVVDVVVVVVARISHESHMVGHNFRADAPESESVQSLTLNTIPHRSASKASLHLGNVEVVVEVDVVVDVLVCVEVEVVTVEVVHEPQSTGQV